MRTLLTFLIATLLFGHTALAKIEGSFELFPGMTPPKEKSLDQVVVYEFFAYLCGHCDAFNQELPRLKAHFGNKLKIVAVPLDWGGEDPGRLMYIARKAGKETAVSNMIFDFFHRKGLGQSVYERGKLMYVAKLNSLSKEFETDMDSPEIIQQMKDGVALANKYKVDHTPTLVIEGSLVTGGNPDNLKKIVNSLLKEPVP